MLRSTLDVPNQKPWTQLSMFSRAPQVILLQGEVSELLSLSPLLSLWSSSGERSGVESKTSVILASES